MRVNLPKGFLASLSKKCREELTKAANEFKYEEYAIESETTFSTSSYSHVIPMTASYMFYDMYSGSPVPTKPKKEKVKNVVKTLQTGFQFDEEMDEKQKELAEKFELLKSKEELEKLKASISNIKDVLKD